MQNKKFLKVMFGRKSGADNSVEYRINEINVADKWNPNALTPEEMGGFNFSVEDKIIRWLVRGDTIYDVEIPLDADVIEIDHKSTPHGVFRTNKIIIKNPRKVTDELAMEFYLKSNIPESSYYKAMAGCTVRGYLDTAKRIINDRVDFTNIDLVLHEFEDFCNWDSKQNFSIDNLNDSTREIYKLLLRIKEEKSDNEL